MDPDIVFASGEGVVGSEDRQGWLRLEVWDGTDLGCIVDAMVMCRKYLLACSRCAAGTFDNGEHPVEGFPARIKCKVTW